MIVRHHEHSFDLDLIEKGQWALDVGCRGFQLPHMLAHHGVNVIAVDADPSVLGPPAGIPPLNFVSAAVVHRELAANKRIMLWKHPHDQQAHSVISQVGSPRSVDTISIPAIMKRFGVNQLALTKLDCEGAEYRLMHDIADAAAAGDFWTRQISVEYHDFCGLNPQENMDPWYARLHQRLSPWFEVARHQREVPPWGGSPHFIDSLYILRKEFWK